MGRVATAGMAATMVMLAVCAPAGARGSLPDKLERSARSGQAQTPPSNDTYAEELEINDSALGFNDEATEDDEELLTWLDPHGLGCSDAGTESTSGWPMRNTLWYWVRGTGRIISVDAAGAGVDTILSVYDDTTGRFVICNDDVADLDGYRWSALRFRSQAGRDYLLQVGSACRDQIWFSFCRGARGAGLLVVGAATQPADDDRAAASALTLGHQTTVSLLGATEEPGEDVDCDGAPFGKTRWFRVNVPAPGTLTVAATSAGHDSVVGVYTLGGGAPLACNDDTDGTSSSAQVSTAVNAGAYLVQLGGYLPGVAADDSEPTVLSANFAENFDVDGDGVARGPDCDDRNPGIRPGIADVANNDVDENCDGLKAQDADHDSHLRAGTGGGDCNDANAAIRPGAPEVRGNGIDENCDGKDDALARVTSNPVIRWKFYRQDSEIEVVRVEVTDLAANTTATVTCSGRGCPKRRSQTKTVKRSTEKLRFDLRFDKRLRRSATVTLAVTRPGRIGVVREITVGRRGVSDRTLCLWPNESRPRRCTDDG